ncbi:MAG: winged helix-turn-helix domain-containing protein [Acidimicrobiales bacterium]
MTTGRDSLRADEARRIALAAQGFADPAPIGRVDRRHLRRVMNRIGLLQLDSVPVVIRTQYLPLFSRLGPYRPRLLDEIAYRDDEWFEGWAHEASLLPVGDEPLYRWMRERAAAGGTWGGLVELAEREPHYVADVLAEVADRGPLRAGDLSDPRPRAGEWWGSRSVGQLALDWLFRIGVVGVRRTPTFEKEFDLLERIVPAAIRAQPTPAPADAIRALLGRAGAALGVATAEDLVDYHRLPKREAKALIGDLVEAGELIPVDVEGWGAPAFRHVDARCPRSIGAVTLLSPFDPVVWHRPRARRLFGFDYRIEIYVPPAKRRWGYYVLPLLAGDELVGRLDCKTHRDRSALEVRAAFAEPGRATAAVAVAAAAATADLAQLVGADAVEVATQGDLAPALTDAVRALSLR